MLPGRFTPQFLHQLELLRISARRRFLGSRQGGHVSLRRGHGMEFSDYRNYDQGDNPRLIDWGLYARTDRLYVKRFNEEEDLHVLILLDTSASMDVPRADAKWEMARDVALAAAYVALMQQDSVVLAALGHFISARTRGARAIHELAAELQEVSCGGDINLESEVQRALNRVRFPGVAMLISDFLMPFENIERACNALRARNLDITAIQILSQTDIDPYPHAEHLDLLDAETNARISVELSPAVRDSYRHALQLHHDKLREYFDGTRIRFRSMRSDEELEGRVHQLFSRSSLVN